MLDRRTFLISATAAIATGCSGNTTAKLPPKPSLTKPVSTDYVQMYAARPQERFPIPAVDISKIDPKFYRQVVDYNSSAQPGSIVVETHERFLYLAMGDGKAMRYGVGIGRDGFAWGGRARIARKKAWPTWTPPADMIKRQPKLAKYKNGMDPGLDNPLGARALYIFEGNKDTLYRIHGTSETWSIGNAASSGCVRMLQQDVIDLYNRVPEGTPITVYQV